MISAQEFKKQIATILGPGLRTAGFKGSGFRFSKSSEKFVFVIAVQASLYGGHCYMELGIQPKAIDSINGKVINMDKVKHYECEFRMRLKGAYNSSQWSYSDTIEENRKAAESVLEAVKNEALPIVSRFEGDPLLLDRIGMDDLVNLHNNISPILVGVSWMMGETRLAWALTKIHEKTNLQKAKQFAAYGLSKLPETSTFFGRRDFELVLAKPD